MSELADPAVTLDAAATAVQNVELLKAEGLPSALLSSPLSRLRKSQQGHLEAALAAMTAEQERVLQLVAAAEALHAHRRQSAGTWRETEEVRLEVLRAWHERPGSLGAAVMGRTKNRFARG